MQIDTSYAEKNKIYFFDVFAIYAIWLAAALDPVGNNGGFRYAAFAFVVLVVAINSFRSRYADKKKIRFVVLFGFFLPAYGLFIYAIRDGGGSVEDTSYIAAGVLTICVFLYRSERHMIEGEKALNLSALLLAVLIVTVFFLSLVNPQNPFIGILVKNGVALVGSRVYGDLELPYIYFVASPLLPLGFALSICNFFTLGKWRVFYFCAVLLIAVAMFLVGTRMSQLLILIVFFVSLSIYSVRGRHAIYIASLLLLVIFVALEQSYLGGVFSFGEGSINTKLSYLDTYRLILDGVDVAFFGQGFNAHVWSTPFSDMIKNEEGTRTELTYIELLRVFGVPIGLVIIFYFVMMIVREKSSKWKLIGCIVLLQSISNPYLFSSNGFLPLTLLVGRHYLKRTVRENSK